MNKSLIAAALAAMLATACATPHAPAPLATNFETSKQHKLQAAAHWNTSMPTHRPSSAPSPAS